jgi:hypothetical protein
MAELDKPEFKFPDEIENETPTTDAEDDKLLIEVEDDTPPQDKGRESFSEADKKELYDDELEDYSEKVRRKLKQMKKLAHDERREKEQALREQQEAIAVAQRILQENNRLKTSLHDREKDVLNSIQRAVDLELAEAKRGYKEAYESGESERLLEAQQRLTEASMKADKVKNYRPAPPEPQYEMPRPQAPAVQPDPIALEWKKNNDWFGEDDEMTSLALGLHERLKKEGVVISSPEYYRRIDETMKKRFPERFESDTEIEEAKPQKISSVVAPATRSTGTKKIRLKTSQLAIAKKLGLTAEQYATEVLKLEA